MFISAVNGHSVSLSENTPLRFAALTAFYIAQGLPLGLSLFAFPAWYTAHGASPEAIATFVAITSIPLALKIFLGPFLDRFSFLPMGKHRPWILVSQLLLLVTSLLLLLITKPEESLFLVCGFCTALNIFGAFQDVAVDGLAVSVCPSGERGKLNGFLVAGQTVGMAVTGMFGVAFLNRSGLPAVAVLLVCSFALAVLVTSLIRERPGEKRFPWTKGKASSSESLQSGFKILLWNLLKIISRPTSLILIGIALLFRSLDGVLLSWGPQHAINDLGYSEEAYSQVLSGVRVVAAFAGLGLGFIVDRVGALNSVKWVFVGFAGLYLGLFFADSFLSHPKVGMVALMSVFLCHAMASIGILALLMRFCDKDIAATQFACYASLANLGIPIGSTILSSFGSFAEGGRVFFVMTGLSLITAVLATF